MSSAKARIGSLSSSAGEVWDGLGFLSRLPYFFGHPVSSDQASLILSQRLSQRKERFLSVLRKVLAESPHHPYLQLFRMAGCGWGDVEHLIAEEGVEGALSALYKKGVYLTVEEFKGRRAIVRGSFRMSVQPRLFQTKSGKSKVMAQTSGSGGPRTPIPLSLDYIRSRSVNALLNLKACAGTGWTHGLWAVPGSSALAYLLELAGCGIQPNRWFSQIDPAAPGLHPRYRWSARALRWSSLLAGLRLPGLIHIPLDDPEPIIRWMRDLLHKAATPHLFTYTSSAIRLSQAAHRVGASLFGVRMTVTGEPVTNTRLEAIQSSGARVVPRYGAAESGTIGYGCLAPEHPDEVHLLTDRLAVFQSEDGTFFVTTLDSAAPFFLLNVSLGDRGEIIRRNCACPLERLGWTSHLHSISCSEKMTTEGMTFLKADVARIIDEVLPARLGGGPTHYQLLEEDDDQGRPRLCLLIHPCVGPIDPDTASHVFIEALSRGSGVERVMGLLWREARLVRVERRSPVSTESGKILPVMMARGHRFGSSDDKISGQTRPDAPI